jgi:hypothetical protein
VKKALCLAILFTSALWADEAANRAAVEATISGLNSFQARLQARPDLFTNDFPNAAEFKRFQDTVLPPAVTVVISRAPMGEATWYPASAGAGFVTRSVAFVSLDTAIVVATCERQSVLFIVKNESSHWRIASFRVLPEAPTKAVL